MLLSTTLLNKRNHPKVFFDDDVYYWLSDRVYIIPNMSRKYRICDIDLRLLWQIPSRTKQIWIELYNNPVKGSFKIRNFYRGAAQIGQLDNVIFTAEMIELFNYLFDRYGQIYVRILY